MLRPLWRLAPATTSREFRCSRVRHRSYSRQRFDPLRILFCGADEFSIYSLRALHALQQQRPEKITSIDVVCRPDKRVGRGLRQIQEVLIKGVAAQLGLKLHQIDTFTGWSPPSPVDLVIAVSFGLLVPPRILNAAKYGGLNVHPSLLPDLRGPAPLQHTLLNRRTHTGVSLQTLHPMHFDQGTILAQTPLPGVWVPADCRPPELLDMLGPLGAKMLCKGIEDGLFVPPVRDVREGAPQLSEQQLLHAPKIKPEDRHIDWQSWSADEILLRWRALGRLWDTQTYANCANNGSTSKRVTFSGPWTKQMAGAESQDIEPGQPVFAGVDKSKLGLSTVDGVIVVPASATIEGEQKDKGLATLLRSFKRAQYSQDDHL